MLKINKLWNRCGNNKINYLVDFSILLDNFFLNEIRNVISLSLNEKKKCHFLDHIYRKTSWFSVKKMETYSLVSAVCNSWVLHFLNFFYTLFVSIWRIFYHIIHNNYIILWFFLPKISIYSNSKKMYLCVWGHSFRRMILLFLKWKCNILSFIVFILLHFCIHSFLAWFLTRIIHVHIHI